MNTDVPYPYTLTVLPCETPAGHYRWEIRKSGKLLQRSDKPHTSEKLAREKAEAELERYLRPGRDGR